VLQRFGFDAEGRPTTAKVTPPAKPKPKDDIEEEAKLLAGFSGFSGSMLEGMPVVGPLVQRGMAGARAAVDVAADKIRGRSITDLVTGRQPRSYGEHYDRELETVRRAAEIYREQNPVRAIAGNVAGAGMLTGPVAATQLGGRLLGTVGATLGARVYGGAAGGTLIGGTDAALRGENPVTGAALGAGMGAAGPVVGEAIGRTYGAVRNAFRTPPDGLRDINPIGREWLTSAMANETPASIQAARARMGPQGFAADLNPSMTELAAGMATRAEPPASAEIGEAYRTRQAQARQVTEAALNRTIGPRLNIEHFRDAITDARAAVADPLYEAWRSTEVVPTQELREMIPALGRLGLLREGEEHALMRGVPFLNPETPATAASGHPTTESWDAIKRAIDARIERAYSSGANTRAADLVVLKNRLINEIRRTPAGPIWDQARGAFAEQSELLNQMAAGRDTFLGGRAGGTADQLREELRGLSAPERQARLVGVRQAADETMGATQNGDTTLRGRFLAPNNQEKLRLLLGRQRADELIRTVEQQAYLGQQAQYVNPRAGSATAGRTQAASRLEAPALGHWDPSVSRPFSWLPPGWIDALRPSTVLQGGRNASYAGARQQLPSALLARGGRLDEFLTGVQAENAARAQVARRGAQITQASTQALTGPGSEILRLEQERHRAGLPALSGFLSAPAH
jgi:hypothetical protein